MELVVAQSTIFLLLFLKVQVTSVSNVVHRGTMHLSESIREPVERMHIGIFFCDNMLDSC